MPSKVNKQRLCPYNIPSIPKSSQVSKTLNRRDLWDALEFFRIEALLRSQLLWALYQQARRRASRHKGVRVPHPKNRQQWIAWYGRNKVILRGEANADVRALLWDDTLRDRFAVADGWAILLGSHHRYLKVDLAPNAFEIPDPNNRSSFRLSEGIVDLGALAREHNYGLPLKELRKDQKRFLYLKIDAAVSPTGNINGLRDLFEKRHKAVTVTVQQPTIDPRTGKQTIPYHPRKDPPITDVQAWLKYIQCYELRHFQGLQDDEIATKVYGSEESIGFVETVQKAVSRFAKLIAAAEKIAWPPTNLP